MPTASGKNSAYPAVSTVIGVGRQFGGKPPFSLIRTRAAASSSAEQVLPTRSRRMQGTRADIQEHEIEDPVRIFVKLTMAIACSGNRRQN